MVLCSIPDETEIEFLRKVADDLNRYGGTIDLYGGKYVAVRPHPGETPACVVCGSLYLEEEYNPDRFKSDTSIPSEIMEGMKFRIYIPMRSILKVSIGHIHEGWD